MKKEELVSLVIKAKGNDKKALDELMNDFYPRLYFFALKYVQDESLASDICQDACVMIITHLSSLKDPSAFVSFAYKIVANKAKDIARKQAHEAQFAENDDGGTLLDTVEDDQRESLPEQVLEDKEFSSVMQSMISELPDAQRIALLLHYYDMMSVNEISEIQGVSTGTVKSRLNYARKAVKSQIEEYEKKHSVKLHSVSALLYQLFSKEASECGSVSFVLPATITATNAASAAASSFAVGIITKILASALAIAVLGGGIAGISHISKSRKQDPAGSQEEQLQLSEEKEKNDFAKSMYNKVLMSEEKLLIGDISYKFAVCDTALGPVHEQQTSIAYIDFDKDGIEEMLVSCGGGGAYILNYDFEYERVYANYFPPDGASCFFSDGLYWHDYTTKNKRYRISAFNHGKLSVEEITYADKMPSDKPISLQSHDIENYSYGLRYTPNDQKNAYTLSGGRCTDEHVTVPPTYNGLPVTALGDEAFRYEREIKSLQLPDSIKYIGDHAFAESTSIEKVIFPREAEFGKNTFYKCERLRSVVLPEKTEKLSYQMFSGCKNLTEITLPDGLKKIGDYAFSECTSLISVNIPDTVNEIGSSAFSQTMIRKIRIPHNVKEVGNHAFFDCDKLESVELSEGIEVLKDAVFHGCISIKEITLPSSLKELDGQDTFSDCTSLERMVLPPSVKKIPHACFKNCTSLREIIIGDGVEMILTEAFSGCSSLQSISVPYGVTLIMGSALPVQTLKEIRYDGTLAQFRSINNTDISGIGVTLICSDQTVVL